MTFMAKIKRQFPIIVERDGDGFYVVECPTFSGCYTQGKTLDEALKNIQEAILLCLEERENQKLAKFYVPKEIIFHVVAV
jgi:predicted RNase H-like HicB family nuclease